MKIYLSASTAPDESDRVRLAIAQLHAYGFTIISTWPDTIMDVDDANPRDASDVERRRWSATDLAEIGDADAVWFLVPTPPTATRGAWLECGYALARGKGLVFSGDTRQSIFTALGVECMTDDGALQYLKFLRGDIDTSEDNDEIH